MNVESMYAKGFRHKRGGFVSAEDMSELLAAYGPDESAQVVVEPSESRAEQPTDAQVAVEESPTPEKA